MEKTLSNIRRIYYITFLLFLPSFSYAISNPYRGGEVIISIKNNNPCFTINNSLEKKGGFNIVIYEDNLQNPEIPKIWSYESNYERDFKNENDCVVINNFSTSNLKLDTYYSVTLSDIKIAYENDFCITKKNEDYVVQDYDFKNDKCVDKELSFWKKLKSFFNKVFSFLF
ncbi:hypothetical protein M0D70_04755 [Acinetobacter portensis]|uniref:Uncharacterized protein n=1 Tax=Acinetobacter portensis TaxID=1839785 RepID=A0ABY4JZY7_9GAMM|nr:NF045616 family extracytoplasmic (lipo)protein [Acinetobacter portensis]MCK7608634.1 hypothetical protein [Acinetobacter portensis]MCK7639479.1 hypothetical protein [Acinetobacter portensis]UPO23802.1 hypothetical protein MZO21_02940 [Acinetobacter portensis]